MHTFIFYNHAKKTEYINKVGKVHCIKNGYIKRYLYRGSSLTTPVKIVSYDDNLDNILYNLNIISGISYNKSKYFISTITAYDINNNEFTGFIIT